MIEGPSPDFSLRRCVASMAFIRDDKIECMDRNVQFVGFIIDFFVTAPHSVATEQIDRHSLNRGDVYERVSRFRRLKMGFWKKFGIKFLLLSKIFLLKPLAVHFKDLVEFETLIGVE